MAMTFQLTYRDIISTKYKIVSIFYFDMSCLCKNGNTHCAIDVFDKGDMKISNTL